MIAVTPSGCCNEYTSTPVETFSLYSPLLRVEMPQAYSITSSPRAISPAASDSTLPCSAVMIAASSSLRALNSSRNANMTLVRLAIEVLPQAGNAAFAAATPALTSVTDARGTVRATAPVAGLKTSPRLGESPSVAEPLIQWGIVEYMGLLSFGGSPSLCPQRSAIKT